MLGDRLMGEKFIRSPSTILRYHLSYRLVALTLMHSHRSFRFSMLSLAPEYPRNWNFSPEHSGLIALFAMKFHLPIEAPVATAASTLPTLNVRVDYAMPCHTWVSLALRYSFVSAPRAASPSFPFCFACSIHRLQIQTYTLLHPYTCLTAYRVTETTLRYLTTRSSIPRVSSIVKSFSAIYSCKPDCFANFLLSIL